METHARYSLVGLFTVAVIAVGFGFVYWLNNARSFSARAAYLVRFDTSVSGLLPGAPVLFNGIRVGEVADLRVDPTDPHQTLVGIEVDAATPIHTDTRAGLEFGAITGTGSVALTGGKRDAPLLTQQEGKLPLITADRSASQSWTQAGRDVLQRLDELLSENAEPFRSTMANLKEFSATLARNSDKIDSILEGLEKLTGGGPTEPVRVTYDLESPKNFLAIATLPQSQLEVVQPTSLVGMDTQRILMQSGSGETPAFDDAQWADSLPILVQASVVEAFENAGFDLVALSTDGFQADVQLLVDLRRFRISTSPAQVAEVEFAAKLLGSDGRLAGTKIFRRTEPLMTLTATAAASALGRAYGSAVADLVPWVLTRLSATSGGIEP